MRNITKLNKIGPYVFFVSMFLFAAALTFYQAGHTFYPVSFWSISTVFLFVIWLFTPKNWAVLNTHKVLIVLSLIFSVLFFVNLFVYPYSDYGYTGLVFFFGMYAVFLMSLTIAWERHHVKFMLHVLCAFAFLISMYGLYRFVIFPYDRIAGPFYVFGVKETYFPNAFALFLILIIPIQILYLMNQASHDRWTLRKLYFYFSSLIIFTAFFLVFSRAAIISIFILSLFFIAVQMIAAMNKKKFFSGKSIQFFLMLLVASFFVVSVVNWGRSFNYEIGSFYAQLSLEASESRVSFFDRFDYMRAGLAISRNYPFFGAGVNNFKFFYPSYQNVPLLSEHSYNLFVKLVAETGVPALVVAAISIMVLIVFYIKNIGKVEQKYYTGSLGFSILGVTIFSMVDYKLNFVVIVTFLALFLALLLTRFPNKGEFKNGALTKMFVLSVFAIVLMLSVVSIHELYANRYVLKAQKGIEAGENYEKAAESRWFKENLFIESARVYREQYNLDADEENLRKWLAVSKKAVEAHELNPNSWNMYAQALCENKEFEKAFSMFDRAVKIDPVNHIEYYYNILLCRISRGELLKIDYSLFKETLKNYNVLLLENPYLIKDCDNFYYAEKIYDTMRTRTEKWDEELNSMYNHFINLKMVGKRGLEPPPSNSED